MAMVDIFHQDKIIQIDPDNASANPISGPFISIKNLFRFGLNDVVIVIRANAVSNEKIYHKTLNHINQIQIKNICIFL